MDLNKLRECLVHKIIIFKYMNICVYIKFHLYLFGSGEMKGKEMNFGHPKEKSL
jgi:hypothetical protein